MADKVRQKMEALKQEADKAEAKAAELELKLKESNQKYSQVSCVFDQ